MQYFSYVKLIFDMLKLWEPMSRNHVSQSFNDTQTVINKDTHFVSQTIIIHALLKRMTMASFFFTLIFT